MLDLGAVRRHLLEIGSGWGALAIRAAGSAVPGHDGHVLAEQRRSPASGSAAAGLGDRVDVVLQDYRDVEGRYSTIVSVEMIEAVGEAYWPEYFATCDRLLAPGGRVGLQTITMPHRRYLATRHAYGWIHKYIFPGGLIPSLRGDRPTPCTTHTRCASPTPRARPPLRDDAAALAGPLPRPARAGARARVRRHVPADVGVLPRLLRGRIPRPATSASPSCGWRGTVEADADGTRVWVCGASSGIGAALARELAAAAPGGDQRPRRAEQLDERGRQRARRGACRCRSTSPTATAMVAAAAARCARRSAGSTSPC